MDGRPFTSAELAYLRSQRLGRLATAAPDGALQNNPVGFTVNRNAEHGRYLRVAPGCQQEVPQPPFQPERGVRGGRHCLTRPVAGSWRRDPWHRRGARRRRRGQRAPAGDPDLAAADRQLERRKRRTWYARSRRTRSSEGGMTSGPDVLDRAFDHVSALEFAPPVRFVNHGPMACEALSTLGFDQVIDGWVKRIEDSLVEAPGPVEPPWHGEFDWSSQLGDSRLLPQWLGYFDRAIGEEGWRAVVATWVPRLMPGLNGALFHGVIRTSHAVRAIDAVGIAVEASGAHQGPGQLGHLEPTRRGDRAERKRRGPEDGRRRGRRRRGSVLRGDSQHPLPPRRHRRHGRPTAGGSHRASRRRRGGRAAACRPPCPLPQRNPRSSGRRCRVARRVRSARVDERRSPPGEARRGLPSGSRADRWWRLRDCRRHGHRSPTRLTTGRRGPGRPCGYFQVHSGRCVRRPHHQG